MSSTCKVKRKSSLSIHDARIAGLYDLEHTIGKGHFAVVRLAKHVFTGERVAIKVIDKTKLDHISTNHIMQEVRCMKLVQHPNIVRLYEVIDTQTKLFLILELGDYDMFDYIMRNCEKGCDERQAQHYFSQIIKAIDYCHALRVVHRDLKPENVVFFEKLGMAKLTDFGFSNLYTPGETLKTSCGSLAYSAPEILLGDSYEATAVDVWSAGVLLYMLLCGKLPFQEATDGETLTKILDCKYSIPENISNEAKSLISRMLVRDPRKRATIAEIVQHPWVIKGDKGLTEALPLIVREHLPDSAHNTIVDQMVIGGIGTEDEILNALESDEYSYITATYYLLAERVLSSIRQEQAARLLTNIPSTSDTEEKDIDLEFSKDTTSIPINARSRSNSFRGFPNRRQCSILKEESEEELSSYLRSSSRQSSRVFNILSHPENRLGLLQKRSTTDEISLNSSSPSSSIKSPPPLLSVFSFNSEDTLTPINENEIPVEVVDGPGNITESLQVLSNSPSIVSDNSSVVTLHEDDDSDNRQKSPPISVCSFKSLDLSSTIRRLRRKKSIKLSRTASAPSDKSKCSLTRQLSSCVPSSNKSLKMPLIRRNSSPSVSMLGLTSIASSRDRVSPQVIQGLLEVTRISSRMGRAASPDSRISSRSPSPTSTSGRQSPNQLGTFVCRIKSNMLPSSGMRKLSSSPHLLGICEESEDLTDTIPINNSKSTTPYNYPQTRSTRSSSMVVNTIPEVIPTKRKISEGKLDRKHNDSYGSGGMTYNNARSVRYRQAIVSPDFIKRYETHQKIVNKTRRSMSCSSSETSEDDSQERRLSLINQKYCQKRDDHFSDDDDPSAFKGHSQTNTSLSKQVSKNSSVPSQSDNVEKSSTSKNAKNCSKNGGYIDESLSVCTSLDTIVENIIDNIEQKKCTQTTIFFRSEIAEKVLCDIENDQKNRNILKVLRKTESLNNVHKRNSNNQEEYSSLQSILSSSFESLHSQDSGYILDRESPTSEFVQGTNDIGNSTIESRDFVISTF
uniref:SNF-related serine/threonine-protein kinase n=1 Tax=Strongyloides venezuelensis TaxID=75913 RepID=A0A0K0F7D1_STRVS